MLVWTWFCKFILFWLNFNTFWSVKCKEGPLFRVAFEMGDSQPVILNEKQKTIEFHLKHYEITQPSTCWCMLWWFKNNCIHIFEHQVSIVSKFLCLFERFCCKGNNRRKVKNKFLPLTAEKDKMNARFKWFFKKQKILNETENSDYKFLIRWFWVSSNKKNSKVLNCQKVRST